jgi:hypothetical protein
MKWELAGADLANWSPTSGGFSGGNATTTWTDPGSGSPNREFTATAWADMNGDGTANADEPTRELELVVGKATFTMYADQPVPETRDIIDLGVMGVGAGSVGHTFWRVDVTPAVLPRISTVLHPFANNTWGYYPVGDVGPDTPSATGFLNPDNGHGWDARKIYVLERFSQLSDVLQYTKDKDDSPGTYHICSNNCTTVAIGAAEAADLPIPKTFRTETVTHWSTSDTFLFQGYNPGDMGEDLVAAGGDRGSTGTDDKKWTW